MTEVYAVFRGSAFNPVLVCVFASEDDAVAWCREAKADCAINNNYWVEPYPFCPATVPA